MELAADIYRFEPVRKAPLRRNLNWAWTGLLALLSMGDNTTTTPTTDVRVLRRSDGEVIGTIADNWGLHGANTDLLAVLEDEAGRMSADEFVEKWSLARR